MSASEKKEKKNTNNHNTGKDIAIREENEGEDAEEDGEDDQEKNIVK